MIRFTCSCGKHIVTPEANAGKRGKCPGCGAIIEIPPLPPMSDGRSPDPPPLRQANPTTKPPLLPQPPPQVPPPMPISAPRYPAPQDFDDSWLSDGNNAAISAEKPEAGAAPISGELIPSSEKTGGLSPFPDLSVFGDSPRDFVDKAGAIIKVVSSQRITTIRDAKAAKSRLIQAQKLLRLVKKEIAAKVRMSNAVFENERSQVNQQYGKGDFFTGLLFGAGAVREDHAARRSRLAMEKRTVAESYNIAKSFIDSALLEMDSVKLQIESRIEALR